MLSGRGPSSATFMVVFDFAEGVQLANNDAFGGYYQSYIGGFLEEFGGKNVLHQIYRTALVKDAMTLQPKGARKQTVLEYIESKSPRNKYGEILINEINTINPNVILACGDAAFMFLSGIKGVRKYRGSIMPLGGKAYMGGVNKRQMRIAPIIAPRDIRKNYSSFFYTTLDVARAWKLRDVTEPILDKNIYWVCRSLQAFRNYVDRNKNPEFAVTDIETHHGYITCMGICTNGREGMCVPLLENKMSGPELAMLYYELAKYLESVPLVNQNIYYDNHESEKFGFRYPNIVGDTMLLGGTIYPEFPKNLGFYTSIYTDMPYFKDESKEFDPALSTKDQLFKYNAKDCISTHQCWTRMKEDAKETPTIVGETVWDFYQKGPHQFYAVYKKIMDRGLYVDFAQRDKLIEKYTAILAGYELAISATLGNDLNFNAPKQVAEVLYGQLNLPAQKHKNAKGQWVLSTDEKTLEFLILNVIRSTEIAKLVYNILFARKVYRILGILDCFIHLDGRLRTSYNLTGTDSGRTSTSYSNDNWHIIDEKGKIVRKKMGLPLQTIRKQGFELPDGSFLGGDIRSIFVPTPGYTFVLGDQSQAEARFVAILAKDDELYGQLVNKRPWTAEEQVERAELLAKHKHLKLAPKPDVHTWTASLVLSKPIHAISTTDRELKGKRPRHAGNYGMAAAKLSELALIPITEAKKALDAFHRAAPKVQQVFQRDCEDTIRDQRFLVNSFGRRRDFFNRVDNSMFRVAYSYLPQSTISDITKFAALKVDNSYEHHFWLGEFHDGLFGEVPTERVDEFMPIFKEAMEMEVDCSLGSMPRDFVLSIPCELETSTTHWKDTQEYKCE